MGGWLWLFFREAFCWQRDLLLPCLPCLSISVIINMLLYWSVNIPHHFFHYNFSLYIFNVIYFFQKCISHIVSVPKKTKKKTKCDQYLHYITYTKFSHHCHKVSITWPQMQVKNSKKCLIINIKNIFVKKVVCGWVDVAYVWTVLQR